MKEALANIITNSKKIKFDLPVNKCSDFTCIDESLPTLIIGYENAKKYINDFNILKKFYPKQNIYWTFKRTERGIDYETDLNNFYTTIITEFCDNIKYTLIDVIKLDFKKTRKLIQFAKSDEKKMIFNENNRFLYVYCEKYKTVFGFSLSTAKFFGIKPNKIIKLFKKNENNEFVYDFTNIPYDVKYIIGEKIDKYMALYDYFTVQNIFIINN